MKKKALYISIFLFIISLISFFIIEKTYIKQSQAYYINAIKQEIKTLIQTKQKATFDIAKNISIDKNLINIIKNNQYDILYKNNTKFFPIYDDYKTFNNIGINIIDNTGVVRYRSWSKNGLNKNILKYRHDLVEFLENPKSISHIIVGVFDIVFKATIPIFENEKLLAILEVVTHFNSIVKKLESQHIYGAVILTKKQTQKIKFDKFGQFIDNHFISTKISPIAYNYLKEDLEKYINIDPNSFGYVIRNNDLFDGYFVVNIPIKHKKETIGYFIAFIEDSYNLREKEIALDIIMIIISILFISVGYIAYKNSKEIDSLIKSLHNEVQKQISEKLQLIYTDPLTKAYKKTKFEIDKIKYLESKVVMLNIKNFSKINELYGFKAGDEILKITTQRIENLLNNKIYRINADEFVFFSKNIKKDILEIKNLFIKNPINLTKNNIKIRLSFSFAVTENKGSEILRKLSIALKEAKKTPFKEFVVYEEKPIKTDFLKFNSLLYDAIFIHKHTKITPYFQGIVDNKTGQIIKYEALARLENDKIYTPYFFLKIAKNSGFLFEITKIIIDKSFKQLSLHKDIEISINITEDDLLTYQLKTYLLDKLEKYNLQPNRITLEILEGITSTGTKNNLQQLKELKEIGFKLAIDDFGVEYSNFERINELDIDFIKIDGKYIKNIDSNQKSYKIAKAITDFAHSLNIKVIAEFVENEEIQKIVTELGIEYSQGYYFSKPNKEIK